MLGQAVTECNADGVVYGGQTLQAKTLIWAAGVRASPAAEWLGARPTAPAACKCCPTSPFPAIPISSPSAIPS